MSSDIMVVVGLYVPLYSPSCPVLLSPGKTLQTISLILSNPPEGYEYGKTDGDEIEAPICTVIVCPKTVISNWIQQIGDFVEPGTLKIKT